jgi:hypothetical protein
MGRIDMRRPRAQILAVVQVRRDAASVGNHSHVELATVSKLLRGLAAGYGAKKLGGGCLGTILVFLLLWWLLGHFEIFK